MEMKKATKKQLSKKAIGIIVLVSVLAFSFIAISYAWFRNYLNIGGTNLTTGKISLEINGYGVDSDSNVTVISPITVNGETKSSVIMESSAIILDSYESVYHVYYIIKNPDAEGVNDIDAYVSVSLDNSYIDEELKAIEVSVSEVKTSEMTGMMSDISALSEEQIKSAVAAGALTVPPSDSPSLISDLETAKTRVHIKKGGYSVVRVTYRMPDALIGREGMELVARTSFCLAGKDELPESGSYTEYMVYSADGLRSALANAHTNDKIIVKSNIEFRGDLIINKPLTLDIQFSTLDVFGNILCAYPSQGRLTIDTSRGGSIAVFEKNVTAGSETVSTGGNISIDTPFGYVELLGKNSSDMTLGDIYVEGDITVRASISSAGSRYGQEFVVNGANIYPIASERGDSDGYKDITVGERTRILIMNYTTVGRIISCSSVIEIENRGTVAKIDLSAMELDPDYTSTRPQIYINNYGVFTDSVIALPDSGTLKFVQNSDGSYTGNTKIVSQPGSGGMTVAPVNDGFVSDGSRNPIYDHIEYVNLETFIEKVNGRDDEIIVQYTRETGLFLPNTSTDIGSSLSTLIRYYTGEISASEHAGSSDSAFVNQSLRITSAQNIKYIKIICLSTELTESDYEFIRTMSSLTSIDLSESASAELSVPSEALSGLSSLVSVTMSEFDNNWGNNIFRGTGVDEIRLPDALSTVESKNTFTDVKYIHTASRFVENISVSGCEMLIFVPDSTTFEAYNNSSYYGKVFYEAERYKTDTGDYFLRLNKEDKTAEFAAFMPSSYPYSQFNIESELNGDAKFDFNTITVGNIVYEIKVYGTYSFYGKTFTTVQDDKITLGSGITTVEPFAFGNVSGADTLIIEGKTTLGANSFYGLKTNYINITDNAYIGDNAFMTSTALRIYAPIVTDTGRNSFREMGLLIHAYLPSLRRTNEPFYGCQNIYRLDIGIFEKNTMFGQNSANIKYTFIHTDETDIPEKYTYTLSYTGIDASNNGSRFLFVPSSFASIYTNYGVKIDIGDLNVSSIKEYYDENDENIVEYTNTYNTSMKKQFKQPNIYYIDYNDGTAKIIKFHKARPSVDTDIFAVPKNDGSGENYIIKELAEYSYRDVSIERDEFTFAPSITKIGAYGFYGSNKKIGVLDLANVEHVGSRAFSDNESAFIVGENVTVMGTYAFANNKNVLKLEFPSLDSGESTTGEGYYFYGCSALKYAYMGPMDGGVQEYLFSGCNALRFVIVDARERVSGIDPPKNINSGNTARFLVIGTSNHSFPNSSQVNLDLSNIVVSGSVSFTSQVNGKAYSVSLPKAMYRINNDEKSASILKYSDPSVTMERYTVPSQIIPEDETAQFFGFDFKQCIDTPITNESGIPVKSIADYAYSGVNFGETIFNIGPYITSLEAVMISGSTMKYIELENVEYVGKNAFHGSAAHSIKADNVKIAEYWSFGECKNLKELYLPAIEEMRDWLVYGCTKLETLVIGENIRKMGTGEFTNCNSLKTVIFLSLDKVNIPSTTFIHPSYQLTPAHQITFYVRAKHVDAYTAEWGEQLGSIVAYESEYTDTDGITYYYKESTDGKVELTYFTLPEGYTMGSSFTFPSQFTVTLDDLTEKTYTVTEIHNMAFEVIDTYGGNVNTIVFPAGLEAINDNASVIPDGVHTFVIDSNSAVFKTVNGVLYSADGTTLILYPRDKVDESFVIPADVTTIAGGAFANNEYITAISGSGQMIVAGKAFYGCSSLESITFTSAESCLFVGTDIFTGCSDELKIYVPSESIEEYREAMIFDDSVKEKILAIQP